MFITSLVPEKANARRAGNVERNENEMNADADAGLAKVCFEQPAPEVKIT